jgi:hypothetical protein
MLLRTGWATEQVLTHPRHMPVGVESRQLSLDVEVEQLEALLAAQLGAGGSEERGHQVAV